MQCAYPDSCEAIATHLSVTEPFTTGLWHNLPYTRDLPDSCHAEFCATHAQLVTEQRNQKKVPDPAAATVSSGPQKPKRSRKPSQAAEPGSHE